MIEREPRLPLGTSMGGQGALRLSYKFPDKFPIAAAISPAIDYQLRYNEGDETIPQMYPDPEAVRQDTATLHIHPLNWPRHQFFCCDPEDYRWWESANRLRMKLYSLGVPHVCDLETTGGGHGFDYYNKWPRGRLNSSWSGWGRNEGELSRRKDPASPGRR